MMHSRLNRRQDQGRNHNTLYTHFIIIINKPHLHKVLFRPQIAGASRGGRI